MRVKCDNCGKIFHLEFENPCICFDCFSLLCSDCRDKHEKVVKDEEGIWIEHEVSVSVVENRYRGPFPYVPLKEFQKGWKENIIK